MVGMMVQALYNVVDRIFVGQAVGPLGIAGTTLAFPFMLVSMALSMLIGFGAAALVSIRLGEKRKVVRSAVVGRFVNKSRAKTNPRTTVTETVRTREKKR